VSGKNYAGSVEEAAGVFIASVPSPPGISASGLSVQTAENNLDMKLDALA
jgi:predicted RNase H-like HicB family nuclease